MFLIDILMFNMTLILHTYFIDFPHRNIESFSEILNPFILRALKVGRAVLSIFSPVVRISPPLGQKCPNMERDVRKAHRANICEDSR